MLPISRAISLLTSVYPAQFCFLGSVMTRGQWLSHHGPEVEYYCLRLRNVFFLGGTTFLFSDARWVLGWPHCDLFLSTNWWTHNKQIVFRVVTMIGVSLPSNHCCSSPWLPSSYLHTALRLLLVSQVQLTLQHTAAILCLRQNTQQITFTTNPKGKKTFRSQLHSRNLRLLYGPITSTILS